MADKYAANAKAWKQKHGMVYFTVPVYREGKAELQAKAAEMKMPVAKLVKEAIKAYCGVDLLTKPQSDNTEE